MKVRTPPNSKGRECVTNSDSSVSCKGSHGTNHYVPETHRNQWKQTETNEQLNNSVITNRLNTPYVSSFQSLVRAGH